MDIAGLIAHGRPSEVWSKLVDFVDQADDVNEQQIRARQVRNEALLRNGCQLLRAARDARQVPTVPAVLRDNVGRALEIRQQVLEASFGSNSNAQQVRTALREAAVAYADHWGYDWWLPSTPAVYGSDAAQRNIVTTTDAGPSVRRRMMNRLADLRDLSGLAQKLDIVAQDLPGGWFHPGLLLVAETLWWLWRDEDLPSDYEAGTYVLLALDTNNPTACPGVVARLCMVRVPGGCGAFYPDPLTCGYLKTDTRFQVALQNAWWIEIGRWLSADIDFDIRWSLTVVDELGEPLHYPVEGRSAEVAIAAALRALRNREALDDNIAATAQLAGPLKYEEPESPGAPLIVSFDDSITGYYPTERVYGLDLKALAPDMAPAVKLKRITRIVVAANQPEQNQVCDNGSIQFVPHTDLESACRELSRWSSMTLAINRRLVELARQLFRRAECDPYVPSTLGRRKTEAEIAKLGPEDRLNEEKLYNSAADREVIVQGRAPVRRFRFFNDSGTGKTMLMIYCLLEIARRYSRASLATHALDEPEPLRVPILLTGLSNFPWTIPDQLKQAFVDHLHAELFAPRDDGTRVPLYPRQQLDEWFGHLYDRGDLVFLCDALDQTSTLLGFDQWTQTTPCRVYVTGRESAIQQAPATSGTFGAWETLRVMRFARAQQVAFLGRALSQQLLLQQNDSEEVRARKEQWQDLVDVPFLLKFLKDLATARDLDGLANRERVYTKAIDQLIRKGRESYRARGMGDVPAEVIRRWLASAAWHMVRSANFTGSVSGSAYLDLTSELQKLGLSAEQINQINVLRHAELRNLMDEDATSLVWRHLSFCEFFAGVYLAEVASDAAVTQLLASVLEMCAAVAAAKRQPGAISPRDRWRWVFRFALSRAHANATNAGRNEQERATASQRLNQLARDLIAHGAPFVVYEAIDKDHVKLDEELDDVCRWLVHQVWDGTDYRSAWKDAEPPTPGDETVQMLRDLFRRPYRDSRVLPAAWQLLEKRGQADAALLSDQLVGCDQQTLDRLLKSFKQCPPDDFQLASATNLWKSPDGRGFVFRMGSLDSDKEKENDEQPPHLVRVDAFELLEFGVSNLAYELFDPGHYFRRDEYSRNDDQPVNWVTWYMADMYAREWLAVVANPEGCKYGLPTECEREFAARAGSGSRYFWGDQYDAERCNAEFRLGRTLGESETTGAYRNDFGVCHMSGNLLEWCGDRYEQNWFSGRCTASEALDINNQPVFESDSGPAAGSFRVLRGGSFSNGPRLCRSARRRYLVPDRMYFFIGFRVCRRLSFAQSSSG